MDSGMNYGDIFVYTLCPSFLCFEFPGNLSSNLCALLRKQDCGAQGKLLCYMAQIDPGWIVEVQNLHIQIEAWGKINWCKAKDLSAFYSRRAYVAQVKRIWDWNLQEGVRSKFWGFFVQLYCIPLFLLSRKEAWRCLWCNSRQEAAHLPELLSVSLTTYVLLYRNI